MIKNETVRQKIWFQISAS